MKKTNLLAILACISLVFSSCNTEDEVALDSPNVKSLKSFEIKKDLSGKYYLDFDVNDGTKVDKFYNKETKTNELYLSSSDVNAKNNFSEEFGLNNSELKIGFVDMASSNSKSISIVDDNIVLAKGKSQRLKSYSVKSVEDGIYKLDFKVSNGISVDFTYNEDIDTYEIHLDNGKSSKKNFTKNFEKEAGKVLKIDFVNHYANSSSKSESLEAPRKPKIIIDTFGDNF